MHLSVYITVRVRLTCCCRISLLLFLALSLFTERILEMQLLRLRIFHFTPVGHKTFGKVAV